MGCAKKLLELLEKIKFYKIATSYEIFKQQNLISAHLFVNLMGIKRFSSIFVEFYI